MAILQDIVSAARELRADMKIDPKQAIEGVLVVREPARAMVAEQLAGIERLGGAKLEVQAERAETSKAQSAGFPEFDLIVRVRRTGGQHQRTRIQKETEQLEKAYRQLGTAARR